MKKLKLILLTAVAVLFTSVVAAQTMADLIAKHKEGMEIAKAKKFHEGAAKLEEVVKMGGTIGDEAKENVANAKKDIVQCYILSGRLNASNKNFDEAIKDFETAQTKASQYGEMALRNQAGQQLSHVYFLSGGTSYNSKDYAKAIETFSKGYKAFPNNTKLALLLADSYDKLGKYENADNTYKGIIALTHSRYAADVATAKKDYTNSLLVRASEAAKKNNLSEVTRLTNEILTVDPKNADATILPIQVATNSKNYSEVIKRAPAAVAAITDPAKKSNVYFYLGAAYQNTENYEKAIDAYKKVTAGDHLATAKSMIAELSK